ncbi:MAG: cytochrome c, partial [Candidatus Binatia bacterium]
QDTALREAPGREVVSARCAACHSLDYIPMNSPFLDRAGWEKTVRKMIDVMGAPIEEKDVPSIVDYLAGAYGKRDAANR